MRQIQKLTEQFFNDIVGFRRHFHQFPELSGNEKETAEFICAQLEKWGIPYQKEVGGYGVVATLTGELPNGSRTVALRADMDALPIQEVSDVPYKSQVPDVMHACGHDVHCAALLGCLMVLNAQKKRFGGTLKAIFQPSEEEFPGGARLMIEAGALRNPNVNVIFAQHVTPEIETGKIGLRAGAFMASTDEIHITVRGKGGHAALPHEYVNPIFGAAAILQNLTEAIKKNQPTNLPTVLSFGKFIANGSTNVVPEIAELAGTFRTFDETWRYDAHQIIQDTADQTARRFGTTCEVNIIKGYPVLENDREVTERAWQYAQEYLGERNVLALSHRLTAEDFAYFAQHRPAVLYRLGTRKNDQKPLHSNAFDIDEKSLKVATGLMSWIAFNELNRQ